MIERLRLGDMLVAAGMVSETQVREALTRQKTTGRRLGETLVSLGYISEAQMTQVLSNQLSIPWVNLYHVDFSRELLELVPADIAEEYCMVPVYVRHVRRQGDTLYVAMDDPLNFDALQLVADCSSLPVKPMVAPPTDIRNAIRVYYLGLPALEAEATEEGAKPIEEVVAQEEEEAPREEQDEIDTQPPPPQEAKAAEPVAVQPTQAAAPAAGGRMLTLLDGTVVRLPTGKSRKPSAEEEQQRGLTTRDLIAALQARAAGEDVSKVLPDSEWESIVAALISILLRKGLIADLEFVDEWNQHRKKKE